MDGYSQDPTISYLGGNMETGSVAEFKTPLYVFDSEILNKNFADYYRLPGL